MEQLTRSELAVHYTQLEIERMLCLRLSDRDAATSAAWQAILREKFLYPWHLMRERDPDENTKRIKIVVEHFDEARRTMRPVIWVEARRPGGSWEEAEEQALESARSLIERDNLGYMFVMTVWGLRFRVFILEKGANRGRILEPLFRGELGGECYYVDITTSFGAERFREAVEGMKKVYKTGFWPVAISRPAHSQIDCWGVME